MDFVKDYQVEKLDGSQVKITGEVPYEQLQKHRSSAIKHLGKDVKLDGFRPGNIPEKVLEEKLGEMTILTEMAERALGEVYPKVVAEHNIDAVGYPQIEVTKLAPENPLGFTATVAVVPEIALPDYKAIAKNTNKEKESPEVTDEEVEKQVEDILRQKVAYERLQQKAAKKAEAEGEKDDKDQGDVTDLPTPESEAEKKEGEEFDPENIELPELTDELVQTLGQPGQFTNVEDFKAKLREHLATEKEREVASKHRAKLTDAIIDETKMELPQVLIDSELKQIEAQMQEELTRAGLSMDDYLAHIKKSKDDLVAEWRPAAEKRAKLQLILNEIAKQEEVKPDEKLVEEQVQQLKEQYKDADESRVRVYVTSILQNEAVMKMLEEQS